MGHTMKILYTVIMGIALLNNANAMRCSNQIVQEGDTATVMYQLCGTPTNNGYSNAVYINKDGDGMNYYIHIDSNGIIDNIDYSRGGLR